MLTDAALRNFKPKSKIYKASDRDGMADGTGWMPAIFKAAGAQDAVQEADPEQDADAVADEPAEALAA